MRLFISINLSDEMRTALVRRAENGFPVEVQPVSMTVDHISLMRSDRGKQGMIYTEIGRI